MLKPKVVLLIFVSGKIVLTGAKVSTCFTYMLLSRTPSCVPHLLSCLLLCCVDESVVLILFVELELTPPLPTSGQGRDLHGLQHDLYRVVRVPQAVIALTGPPLPVVGAAAPRTSPRSLFLSTGPVRARTRRVAQNGLLWRGPRGEADVVHAGCFSLPYPPPMPSPFSYYKAFTLVITLLSYTTKKFVSTCTTTLYSLIMPCPCLRIALSINPGCTHAYPRERRDGWSRYESSHQLNVGKPGPELPGFPNAALTPESLL